jgi:hypothetical protein
MGLMTERLELFTDAFAIGIGATAFMDLWAVLQRRIFGVRSLDYALLGRWLGHLVHGQFRHEAIARTPPITGERAMGWAAHYAIGVVFALFLLAIWGTEWARSPSFGPAMLIGVLTIVFPFFVLQPALGAGVAASRTPQPNIARFRSLVTHTSFGVGLYLAACLLNLAR